MKPFSEACERNREPILAVLKRIFRDRRTVLEIGSGTGQHAAYFARELPHLRSRDPASGVRNFEDVQALAQRCGLALLEDNAMPANNRLLVFKKAP